MFYKHCECLAHHKGKIKIITHFVLTITNHISPTKKIVLCKGGAWMVQLSPVSAHHECKVNCWGTELNFIIASPVHCWGQSNSGESCIGSESRLTCSHIANLLQHLLLAVLRISYCKWGMLRTRLQRGECETLLPDVVVPVAYRMVTAMYVSSVDLLSVHYSKT